MPKEETFPIPLKYIDVTRSSHPDLDVMFRKTHWRILECRFEQIFVRFVERIHKGHSIERKNSKEIDVVRGDGERLTKIQTTRPDHVWPKVLTKIGKAAQNREEQEWAKGKTEARQWILEDWEEFILIDPDDKEYSKKFKNARRKLERPLATAMPCRRQPSIAKVVAKPNSASEKNSKTM